MLVILREVLRILLGIALVIGFICILVIDVQHRGAQYRRIGLGWQLIFLCIGVVICALVWVGTDIWRDWYYEEKPRPFDSAEAAYEAGFVVVSGSWELVEGYDRWLSFADSPVPASIPLAIRDGGGIQTLATLVGEDNGYCFTYSSPYVHQKDTVEEYLFLRKIELLPTEYEAELWSWREVWVLTDKEDLTEEEYRACLYTEEPPYRIRKVLTRTQWVK